MGVRSSTAASIGGRCRAMVKAKQLASGASTEIVQRERGYTACTSAEITSSTAGRPALEASKAKNARSFSMMISARLRSEMSVMLARTSGFGPP